VKILSRYVLKEHLGPLVFALTALTSLLLLNYIAKRFGQLVGKGLPWTTIAEFFVLSVPFTIAMTLPMAVLVAVLYAFSRLAAENEITAFKASGVGMATLLRPVLWGGFALTLLMIGFNDQVLPRSNHRLQVLTSDIARKKPTFALREQVINEVVPGRLFLRANHLEEATNRMREVTIYDLGDPARRRTIYADSGDLRVATNRRDLDLTLFDGTIQTIPANDPAQLQRLFYTTSNFRVRDVLNSLDRSGAAGGMKGDREMSVCEMQAQVDRAAADQRVARTDLSALLVTAAREAAHGASTAGPPPAVATPAARAEPRAGLGRAYCGALGAAVTAFGGTLPPAGTGADGYRQAMGGLYASGQLSTTIESLRARIDDSGQTVNSFEVEIQKKFALAVACTVFVLLGAPIALRFPRGGVGLVIGVSLGVFALYYVGLIAGEALANRAILSPFWSMWATDILFTAVGLLMLARMGHSTGRGGGGGEWMDAIRTRGRRLLQGVGLGGGRPTTVRAGAGS
jgi:lipopolysaccharide export system permease protein